MANPTTNFGWVMPTSTSLVTNLPADFNTFGQGVDTSMAQLKGGTTGQVLSKTSGTDMAFTWVTPTDQTPLTTKGDIFAFSTVDARLAVGANETRLVADSTQTLGLKYVADTTNYAINAKGDLLAGTAADTLQALSVGNNGETLVANSAATSGLTWASPVASLGNPTINGGMDVWQRGTSGFVPGNNSTTFAADRWNIARGVAGSTVSQQATGDTTNLPNIQYAMRVSRDNANTSTSAISIGNSFESVTSIPFASKAVTLTFYARAGANYSAASSALNAELRTGTGTDQNTFSTYTGSATPISSNVTLTTTWQRFALTGTVASSATEMALKFVFTPVGTAGAADYYEITGVQIDVGTWTASTAPTFRRSGGTFQGELAACQRYYYRLSAATGQTNFYIGAGTVNASGNNAYIYTKYPTTMRVVPTFTFLSAGNYYIVSNPQGVATGVGTDNPGVDSAGLTFSKASMTAYASATIQANSASAYIEMSAEL